MSMFACAIDRDMYDHPGATTTMTHAIRKWRNLPALAAGETVTIVRFTFREDYYGLHPRVLISNAAGATRWVAGSDVEPIPPSEGSLKMYARLGEIARERLAYSD